MQYNEGVSVIIPTFNQEKLIERCILSVLASSMQNIQVIIVDDGSYDRSQQIISDYVIKDSRITIVSGKNGGVSFARNLGMKLARYDYIAFVDSDDYVSQNMFIKMMYEIIECETDLVVCSENIVQGCKVVESQNKSISKVLNKGEIVEKLIKPLLGFSKDECIINSCVWGKLFKKELLVFDDVIFRVGRHHGEDWEFIVHYLNLCNMVSFIPDPLYYYNFDLVSGNNLSRRFRPEYFDIGISERKTFRKIAPYLDWNSEEKILDFLSTPKNALIYYRTHCNCIDAFKWFRYIISVIISDEEYCELAKRYMKSSKELYWFCKNLDAYIVLMYCMTTKRVIKNKVKYFING